MNVGALRAVLAARVRSRDRERARFCAAVLALVVAWCCLGRGGWTPAGEPPPPGAHVVVDRGSRWCEGYADSLGVLRRSETGEPIRDAVRWMRPE